MVRSNRGGKRERGQPEPDRSRFTFVEPVESRSLLLADYDDEYDRDLDEPQSPRDWGDTFTQAMRRYPVVFTLAAVGLGVLLGRLIRTD